MLTAAHVIDNAKICFVKVDETMILVSEMITHKEFDMDVIGKYDIAILKLSKSIDMDWYVALYNEDNEIGKTAILAGYGMTGNFLTGATRGDAEKRAGSNKIDSVYQQMLMTSVSKTTKATDLEFLIASGDSGGGLYIDGKLAGVHSCVMATDKKSDSSYGDEAGHTRVSLFVDWINENTKD